MSTRWAGVSICSFMRSMQVGAAGDELGCGLGCRCAGGRDAARPFVAERLHVRPPSATSRIAATMLA